MKLCNSTKALWVKSTWVAVLEAVCMLLHQTLWTCNVCHLITPRGWCDGCNGDKMSLRRSLVGANSFQLCAIVAALPLRHQCKACNSSIVPCGQLCRLSPGTFSGATTAPLVLITAAVMVVRVSRRRTMHIKGSISSTAASLTEGST